MPPFCVVINLQDALERRQRICSELEQMGIEFEIFAAVDGRDGQSLAGSYVCKADFFAPANIRRQKPLNSGEFACTLSHMLAIRCAWLQGRRHPVLILEDDATFCFPDIRLLETLIAHSPEDAAYLQLAVTPAASIGALGEHFAAGGPLMVPKVGPFKLKLADTEIGCHCAAAYLVFERGMRTIAERWFDGDKVIFPCSEEEQMNNVALVADRLVYHALTSDGGCGYVCSVPLMTTTARDSFLHPDHVHGHQVARDTAYAWHERFEPMVLALSERTGKALP